MNEAGRPDPTGSLSWEELASVPMAEKACQGRRPGEKASGWAI